MSHLCCHGSLRWLSIVPAELGNYNHVNTYVAKGEQSQEAKDPIVAAKLKCAAGLAALDAKKYKVAAKKFSEVRSIRQPVAVWLLSTVVEMPAARPGMRKKV